MQHVFFLKKNFMFFETLYHYIFQMSERRYYESHYYFSSQTLYNLQNNFTKTDTQICREGLWDDFEVAFFQNDLKILNK